MIETRAKTYSVVSSQIPENIRDESPLFGEFLELYYKSKLVLHTYIGTGYLETLTMNIPTIIFANTKECMLKEESWERLL